MSPRVKVSFAYALAIGLALAVFLQMALFLIRLAEQGVGHAKLGGALIGFIMAYTLVRLTWQISSQLVLTRRYLQSIHEITDPRWMKKLNRKYRDWGIEILVIQEQKFEAMTIGLFRMKIVVSTGALEMMTPKETEAVLLHERCHCRSYDNLKLFLLRLLVQGFRYLPVVRPVYDYCRIWTELLADRYAIARMGTSLHLGQILLKLVRWGIVPVRPAAVHFSEAALNYRILQIADPDKLVQVRIKLLRPVLYTCCFMLLLILSGSS